MTVRYRFDPTQSRFTVQAFVAGLLSFVGHSPTFRVRDFTGEMSFEGDDLTGTALELTVPSDALDLQDRVSNSNRTEIEGRMQRDVLETAAHHEIKFQAETLDVQPIARDRYRLRADGRLLLHGVTHPHRIDAELQFHEDALRVLGMTRLRLSDHGIRPVTALGGTITLKDELKLSFDLIGLRERGGS